jgi:4-carboxymuconolactone decarboxylase
MHVPLARKAGTSEDTIAAIREGRRPPSMSPGEARVHEFVVELLETKGVAQPTYDAAAGELGEQGLIDLVGLVGYFSLISMVLNVAHTPAQSGNGVEPLPQFPR